MLLIIIKILTFGLIVSGAGISSAMDVGRNGVMFMLVVVMHNLMAMRVGNSTVNGFSVEFVIWN